MTEVLLEILGLWDQPDRKVHLGFLGQQVNQVFKVSVARPGHLGLKVTEGLLGFKESKVTRVTKGSGVCKVILVYQVSLGQLERKDPKGQRGCLDMMVQKDQEVTKDQPGPQDSEVLLVLLEMLEFQEDLGFKDHQGYQEIQDNQEQKVKLVNQEESSMQLVPLLLASQDHLGPLGLPALQELLDYQVPLALLVCLASLVLKVTGGIRETRENQEYP